MKLRNRLAVAFMIILLVPIGLVSLSIVLLNNYQLRLLNQAYGVETENVNMFENNTIELFDALAEKSSRIVQDALAEDTERFRDQDYLEQLDEKLGEKYSDLIVRSNDKYLYFGYETNETTDAAELLSQLPGYGANGAGSSLRIYTGTATNCLMNQNDFEFVKLD